MDIHLSYRLNRGQRRCVAFCWPCRGRHHRTAQRAPPRAPL